MPSTFYVVSVTEERLHYLATPCERCPVVFKEDDQSLTVKDQGILMN